LEYCYLIGKKDHPENWRFQNNLENVDLNEIDLIKTFDLCRLRKSRSSGRGLAGNN
jgi:hypothetical protein